MTEKGKFIVFEGIDGSGTTYHSRQLSNTLNTLGKDVRWTCEPTKSPIGKLIRKYLKGDEELPSWETMTLLFTADRQNHQKFIKEALDQGYWVICDRYAWSTYAYQLAMAKKESTLFSASACLTWMNIMHSFMLKPDVIYHIDIQVETALKRIEKAERDIKEVFEYEETQHEVKQMYEFVKNFFYLIIQHKIYTFDNETQTKEEVAELILSTTKSIFKL